MFLKVPWQTPNIQKSILVKKTARLIVIMTNMILYQAEVVILMSVESINQDRVSGTHEGWCLVLEMETRYKRMDGTPKFSLELILTTI